MDEDNAKIIEMIKNGKSANEMASTLGISNKQLYIKLNRLKCYGINLDRFYHDNGNITYYTPTGNEIFADDWETKSDDTLAEWEYL